MTGLSFFLILLSEMCMVTGQIFFKHAMNQSAEHARRKLVLNLIAGIAVMALGFFLWLGLLARFDLSYLYPFQGLSVIIITLMAAVILKEKLTMQLTIGALLITAGVVLVSLS